MLSGKTEEKASVPPSVVEGKSSSLPAAPSTLLEPDLPPAQDGEAGHSKEIKGEGGGGDKDVVNEGEGEVHKLLTDSNTQGSLGNTRPATDKALEVMEVDQDAKPEEPEKLANKEGKGKEEEDSQTKLRKKRKEVILSLESTEEEQVR